MFALCGEVNIMDGYRDGMLSRTIKILGGGGCKAFGWRAGAWVTTEQNMQRLQELGATKTKTLERNLGKYN